MLGSNFGIDVYLLSYFKFFKCKFLRIFVELYSDLNVWVRELTSK